MSYAYAPGLKVKKLTIVRKSRILPIPGEVLVKEGDYVSNDRVVARTLLLGDITMVNVGAKLGILPIDLPKCMLKKVGDSVKKDEVLAESKSFLNLFKSSVKSEIDGFIEYISNVTGMIAIRHPPVKLDMKAYISGKVAKVISRIGVQIETPASFVQGIFGIGGERIGELKTIAGPKEVLTADMISEDWAGKILIGGALATKEYIEKALDAKSKGIVAGGIKSEEVMDFLGYEIGVAITGHEDIGLTIIVTEGFGKMNMAPHTYNLLKSLEGRLSSISGETQIRAGVIRPEIIVPLEEINLPSYEKEEDKLVEGIEINMLVRIISRPYFGAIGRVSRIPVDLSKIETESPVRIMEVELDGGKRVIVPRANVEIMEE